ncbi:hypothetical protein [Rhizobium leguminosarum]|uniref:hypothetical protein n=1 Tax=Rhizobium leguminosarum TaxID=384 RepID=UPI002E104151|nr:hypothetical protein U8Q02_38140 [Rhizobium leguminosarum]
MIRNSFTRSAALAIAIFAGTAQAMASASCDTDVASALDKQRQEFIASASDLADQNFSRRPGTFASTTCLDTLMKQGGVDIFFKPPSLDTILGMVKNFACQQASQIFDKLVGGNGSMALKVGEIISGVSLDGSSSTLTNSILNSSTPTSNVDVSLRKLFQ